MRIDMSLCQEGLALTQKNSLQHAFTLAGRVFQVHLPASVPRVPLELHAVLRS